VRVAVCVAECQSRPVYRSSRDLTMNVSNFHDVSCSVLLRCVAVCVAVCVLPCVLQCVLQYVLQSVNQGLSIGRRAT